ncbi:NACHT, LRR and PYD domains-containing protein 5 [Trichechus inunguis]
MLEEVKSPSFSIYGLHWCFMELDKDEFEMFKEFLKEETSERMKGSLPWSEVKNANVECLASLLHEYYMGPLIWEISINVFEKMRLSELSEIAKNALKKDYEQIETYPGPRLGEVPEIPQAMEQYGTTAAEIIEEQGDKWDYRAHVMTKFTRELNVCHGFREIATDWSQTQSLVDIFISHRRGQPCTVVLHGKSGTGKSVLTKRIMLHWAQGQLYQGMFSYVFFLHAREIQHMKEGSLAELISMEWPDSCAPVTEIMSQPERLLFVIDGFDDLDFALQDCPEKLCENWAEKQPMSVLIHSLLKKVLLPESSLLITVRDVGIGKLKSMVVSPHYLFVGGIPVELRTQFILQSIVDEQQKTPILTSVLNNSRLFDECQVYNVCQLTSVALQLQYAAGKDVPPICQTLTSLCATFMFHQFTPRDDLWCCLKGEEKAVLKNLCRMAVEGVWNMKLVFCSEDLGVHGLKESELSTLFHMTILPKNVLCEGCYTFFHCSLQEFCAALYYVLEGLERKHDPPLLSIENARSLMKLQQVGFNPHLLQMKRFLFGLMNKELVRKLEALLGHGVPLLIKQELLRWVSLLGEQANTTSPLDFLDAFHCLFEAQDEEFVRLALNNFQEVWLPINQQMDLLVSSFCLQCCQYLQRIRLDIKEIFSTDEVTEAGLESLQRTKPKTLVTVFWQNLCMVLSTHKTLRLLDLSGSVLNEWAMRILCSKLKHPTCKIQTLIFKNAQITLGLQHLWTTLINQELRYLDLEGIHLNNEDIEAVCGALKHPNCSLESLRLDCCGLTHTCCLEISQVLVISASLNSLSLTGNKVTDEGLKTLCNVLSFTRSNLKKLILGNCGLTAAGCEDLALALFTNQNLTHLCLSDNNLGSEGVKLLCGAIKNPSCGLKRLILFLPLCVSYRLSQCNLDVTSCGYLAFALMKNRRLTHLTLSMNPLEDNGIKMLCEVMKEPSCYLQDLELVRCQLTPACCEDLSCVIARNPHLKSLDLAYNALGDSGAVLLCKGLKHKHSSLKRLGLEACGLTSDCCEELSSAIYHNQSLTSLNLMQNHLDPSGLSKLCSASACPKSNLQIIG